jgi:hypothetical protein
MYQAYVLSQIEQAEQTHYIETGNDCTLPWLFLIQQYEICLEFSGQGQNFSLPLSRLPIKKLTCVLSLTTFVSIQEDSLISLDPGLSLPRSTTSLKTSSGMETFEKIS